MAKRSFEKKPLYRKMNTKARGVFHNFGGSYAKKRNTKASKNNASSKQSMGGKVQRGLDYTPLFKFLLSRIGQSWSDTLKEAQGRLDKHEPIFWMVARSEAEMEPYFCVDEATYFSCLFVDENDQLQKVDPSFNETSLPPSCPCCTHTFNGVKFTKKFQSQVAS